MRLAILDNGHGFGTKALFAFIGAVSRQRVLDIIKLVRYRADFFGKPMGAVTHEAMRGESAWSVADRELMAAVVAQTNECVFCRDSHAAVSVAASGDAGKVSAVLADLEAANIDERLRATLRMLRRLAREHRVSADEMREVLDAGVTRAQIEDALAVSFAFNTVTRLAETFNFVVPSEDAMNAGAKFLLARGYR
ncbi:MAG TPA: carboxymuconolactone decarboxylase family protein [Polyangiales bacterium]|nr:carboxymuconolactone decarboxylase family protein [Polyangiales bacterium]